MHSGCLGDQKGSGMLLWCVLDLPLALGKGWLAQLEQVSTLGLSRIGKTRTR